MSIAPKIQAAGYTTATTTRILVFFDDPTAQFGRIAYDDGSGSQSIDAPLVDAPPFRTARFDLTGLTAGAKVQYAVDGAPAVAALTPAPALLASSRVRGVRLLPLGRPLRIGLVSCNDINASNVVPEARRGALWRRMLDEIRAERIDLLIHAGDQIYGDDEPRTRLPTDDRTTAYRRHYVETWSHPDVAAVLAECGSVMMWDDHEIYDGWGSNDGDITPDALARFTAAETAFREFQAALNPPGFDPDSHAWSFDYNGVGVIAVDGRKHRSWASSTVLGDNQLRALEQVLATLAGKGLKHLFVVVGTPPVFVQSIALEKISHTFGLEVLDDIRDGWTSSRNRPECRRFLMTILNFAARSPTTQVTILGGDIHVGTVGRIDTTIPFAGGHRPRLYQVTSSGVARPPPAGIAAAALRVAVRGGTMALFNDDISGRLLEIQGAGAYLLDERNFAILKMENSRGDDWDANGNLWVELFTEGSNGVRPPYEQLLPRMTT